MELGEKLRQARLDARLTQRQLCGDRITRNMLSQIENGLARPSMETLRYLAGQLKKPVSYFLEETAVVSANQEVMARARSCFDLADYAGAAAALEDYQEPDPVYDREKHPASDGVGKEEQPSRHVSGTEEEHNSLGVSNEEEYKFSSTLMSLFSCRVSFLFIS